MIDIHVHYFPESLFKAIWSFFETKSRGLWPIQYKLHGPALVDGLLGFGVSRFTTLVYAHKPGLAAYLNDFVRDASRECPQMLPFGTIYAGDGDCGGTARTLFEDYGFLGIKLHPFVSQEALDDPRFYPAYGVMEGLGKVLLCHPGSGPVYSERDGAERLRRVLQAFPQLKTIVAHCGAFEYGDYRALADDFEHVYFDTAMNCVHAATFERNCPGRDFFLKYQDRMLYGSDYPNIPYTYERQAAALRRLDLGPDVERKLFTENAVRLLGLSHSEP